MKTFFSKLVGGEHKTDTPETHPKAPVTSDKSKSKTSSKSGSKTKHKSKSKSKAKQAPPPQDAFTTPEKSFHERSLSAQSTGTDSGDSFHTADTYDGVNPNDNESIPPPKTLNDRGQTGKGSGDLDPKIAMVEAQVQQLQQQRQQQPQQTFLHTGKIKYLFVNN